MDSRLYNPRPDPNEIGPPKRVNRMEDHIGEVVAASKRRVTWQFTLGESESVHTVVLTHSIMSYKKACTETFTTKSYTPIDINLFIFICSALNLMGIKYTTRILCVIRVYKFQHLYQLMFKLGDNE